jgi:hypothetical protein
VNSSSVLNTIAVAVAFGALAVSLFFAVRQTRVMRQANQMPIFIDMIREFRSREFQQAEHFILHRLRNENSPDKGVLKLPDEARFAVITVQSFFGVLANLVVDGIISEASAVSTLGFRANKIWIELEPFVVGERKIRGDNDFALYFEDFVYRVRTHWPPEKHYKLVINRLESLPNDSARLI